MASVPPSERRQSHLNTTSSKPNVAVAVAVAQGLENISEQPAMFKFDEELVAEAKQGRETAKYYVTKPVSK
jgi:hypothetical protein